MFYWCQKKRSKHFFFTSQEISSILQLWGFECFENFPSPVSSTHWTRYFVDQCLDGCSQPHASRALWKTTVVAGQTVWENPWKKRLTHLLCFSSLMTWSTRGEDKKNVHVYVHISMHPKDLQTMDHSSWNPKQAKTFLNLISQFQTYQPISHHLSHHFRPNFGLLILGSAWTRFMRWIHVGCV